MLHLLGAVDGPSDLWAIEHNASASEVSSSLICSCWVLQKMTHSTRLASPNFPQPRDRCWWKLTCDA